MAGKSILNRLEHGGIELAYSDFTVREYPRPWGGFCPGLSVIDALFNLGPAATAALLAGSASAS